MCGAWRLCPSRPAATVRPADRVGSGTDVSYRGVNAGTSRRREPCRYLRGRRGALPVWLVGAFEKPVAQDLTEGYVTRSVRQLADHERKLEETYGFKPLHGFAVSMESPEAVESLGERISFADLDGRVREVVARRLPGAESE